MTQLGPAREVGAGDCLQSDTACAVVREAARSVGVAPETKSAVSQSRHRALLQIWLSPAFPVGGFAYSHGLEKAVESGWIRDRDSLHAWLGDLVALGSLRNDLILLASASRATVARDWAGLRDISDLAAALAPSRERHLETTQQGGSFVAAIEEAWPADALRWRTAASEAPAAYPVAVGFVSAAHRVPLGETLEVYAVAFVGALTSAAIRLGVVGQTDAQRVMATLLPQLLQAARDAEAASLDDLGGAVWRSDIAAQQHETQATRLFRS